MNEPVIAGPEAALHNADERLPFDARTVLIGIWTWRWILLCWSGLSAIAAVVLAIAFAPRSWDAEAVLLYQPPSDQLLAGMYDAPGIQTQLNMVKVKPNLAETRRRLALPCTLERLGANCDIINPRDSQLLLFHVQWSGAEEAANIANTLSEVFIAKQNELRTRELASVIRDLEGRVDTLNARVTNAGPTDYKQQVHRFERELASYRNRLNTADEIYEKALTEFQAVERQLADVDSMMKEVKQEIASKESVSAKTETISSLNIRVERIREKLLDHRVERMNSVRARQWEDRLQFSERLLAQGYLTEEAFQQELLDWEHFKAQAEDTERMNDLKQELENIYAQMRPSNADGIDSNPLIQALMIQSYTLKLKQSAAEERIEQITASRRRLEQQYQKLLEQRSNLAPSQRKVVEGWQKEIGQLEETLAKVHAIHESGATDLTYVSRAETPGLPSRSLRKPFAIVLTLAASLLGVGAVVVTQIVNISIRSRAEVGLRLGEKVLGTLPDITDRGEELTEDGEVRFREPIRAIARRIRSAVPAPRARILLVSAGEGEGRTTVATHLASCLGQQGEKVVVLDGTLRQNQGGNDLRELILSDQETPPGWGDFLAENVHDVRHVVYPTSMFGVQCVPRSPAPIVPELLGSARLEESFASLPEQMDVLLIDGPAVSSGADAEILAERADAVVLVVQSQRFSASVLRDVLARLRATQTPVLGVVLNKVVRLYLDETW